MKIGDFFHTSDKKGTESYPKKNSVALREIYRVIQKEMNTRVAMTRTGARWWRKCI